MHLSVIIATYKRAPSLDGTLASIAASSYPLEHVQIVVADNAGDSDTRRLCDRYAERLELIYVKETTPGKNSALNAALPHATGEIFLFTDDDIDAPPDWLSETWAAVSRWPKHTVFGGKVLPIWPSAFPPHLNDRRYLGPCFTVLDVNAEEGPSFRFTPFGPNMAVRRTVFDAGVRFNPRVGPRGASYIMGSETELVRRIKNSGYAPVYMPRSIVRHCIRPEQFTDRWLFGRAFRYGRLMEVRREEEDRRRWPALRQAPELIRCMGRTVVAHMGRERKSRFDHAMALATKCGMIYQACQPSPTQHEPRGPTMYAIPPGGLQT